MEKTYTIQEIQSEISLEIINEIKNESKKIHRHITRDTYIYYDHKYISNRAREIAFKGAYYKNQSQIYRNLLAANTAFADEESFIETLINHGFTFEQFIKINDPNLTPTEKLSLVYPLAYTLKQFYGSNVTSLALNKINEIIVFNPTLFNELEQKTTKPIR